MLPVSPTRTFAEAGKVGNREVDASPFMFISTYNVAIFYMLWYLVLNHWNLANHVAWVRFHTDLLNGRPPPQLYLTLVIIAEVVYFIVGGILLYRAAKYAKTDKERNRYLTGGIAVLYAFTDVPLWLADISIFYFLGWQSEVQSITFVLRSISFLGNSIVAWHIYMHRIVKFLHTRMWANRVDVRDIAMKKAKVIRARELRRSLKEQQRERERAQKENDAA
jgi:hypothetical protein